MCFSSMTKPGIKIIILCSRTQHEAVTLTGMGGHQHQSGALGDDFRCLASDVNNASVTESVPSWVS